MYIIIQCSTVYRDCGYLRFPAIPKTSQTFTLTIWRHWLGVQSNWICDFFSTFVPHCVPFLSPLPCRWRFVRTHTIASVQDLLGCIICRGISHTTLCIKHYLVCSNLLRMVNSLALIDGWGSYFHKWVLPAFHGGWIKLMKEILFMLFLIFEWILLC